MSLFVTLRTAFERTRPPRLVLRRSRGPRHAVARTFPPRGAATATEPRRAFSAVAKLLAVTDEARRALGDRQDVSITTFPFKVGRESRSPNSTFRPALVDRRLGEAPQLNDVYLLEPAWSDLLQISREHFLIERAGHQFVVVDRGSVCGTIVADTPIGGNRSGGRTELRDGDLITVGACCSAYVFRFEIVGLPSHGSCGLPGDSV